MTTTELIALLKSKEFGGVTRRPRDINIYVRNEDDSETWVMNNDSHFIVTGAGDGMLGTDIDLTIINSPILKTGVQKEPVELKKGDYVLATKWHDGDSGDQWCCGFFEGMTGHQEPRYDVVDSEGKLFRNNGFRRCEKIHPAIGKYLVEKSHHISAIHLLLWEYVASEAHDIIVENWDYDNKPKDESEDRFAMGTPSVGHAGEDDNKDGE